MATYTEQLGADELYVDNGLRGTIWDAADTIWDGGDTVWDANLNEVAYSEQTGDTVVYT